MKALVTGASGFIGSHVVEALESQGHQVAALVRPTSDTTHLKQTRAELVKGDVTDRESLIKACTGVDAVFHTAAVIDNLANWDYYQQVGVEGTRNVVDAAEQTRVGRFIHFSSITVYGIPTVRRTYSETSPLEHAAPAWNHYVREKVLSERLVAEADRAGRIRATIFRPSIVIGPRDRTIVPRLLRLFTSPLAATVDDGQNHAPMVVVEEVAQTAVKAALIKEAEGKCYNLSGRTIITQSDFVHILAELAGFRYPAIGLPLWAALGAASCVEAIWKLVGAAGEPIITRLGIVLGAADWEIDCTLAQKDLGWTGDADYKEAVKRYLESNRYGGAKCGALP
jgi:2-alkyl-3-oxoalkanoate reductase